jgi:protein-S-isoprenylcysteine O-methyltransferase Ste14
MSALELKVPPPLVAALVALLMWLLPGAATPAAAWPPPPTSVLALFLALAGGAITAAGLFAFRRARTTVNPLRPEKSSSLVTSGVFGFTRNPMYLGLALLLAGWAAQLASPLALLGPVGFVAYAQRFQVLPEERVLGRLFGKEWEAYRTKVRRWL